MSAVLSHASLKDRVDDSLNECMVFILVWVVLEALQRLSLAQPYLWCGSYAFALAWLWRSTSGSAMAQWAGLFLVSLLVWFDQAMALGRVYLLGSLFFITQQLAWKGPCKGIGLLLKVLGGLVLLSLLQVGLSYTWVVWSGNSAYPQISWQHWFSSGLRHGSEMFASLPFYFFCLVPYIKTRLARPQAAPTSQSFEKKAPLGLLCGLATLAWVLNISQIGRLLPPAWMWILALLLAGWAGIYGAITAVYIAFIHMQGIPSAKLSIIVEQTYSLIGLSVMSSSFAYVMHSRLNGLNQDKQALLRWNNLLQGQINNLEQHNQSLNQQMEDRQRLVVRSLQELHAHMTPLLLSSTLFEHNPPYNMEKTVQILRHSIKKQMVVMQDLQDMLQLNGDKPGNHPEKIDLIVCLQSAVTSLKELAHARKVSFNPIEAKHLQAVEGQYNRLQEVFVNLLQHLLNYGEKQAEVSFTFFTQSQKTQLQIEHSNFIKPNGAMDSLIDGHLLASDALALSVNFDVGLYTACRLLENMGGHLSAYERVDQHHQIFVLYLKTWPEDQQDANASTEFIVSQAPTVEVLPAKLHALPPRKLLLIEDDRMTQSLLENILARYGVEVLSCGSAQKGLEVFAHFEPDAVIADLGLPDFNGLELIKQLRQASLRDFYALAFSANNHRDVQLTAIQAGFDAFLAKPLAIHELCKALRLV